MAIYELKSDCINKIKETSFANKGIQERGDLQRLLRDYIEVICPDTMIISEEFGQWEDSNRRIDLLGLDKDANLVVIELKRTEYGGHMELQALRYAAMVSTMTFEQVVIAHSQYLIKREIEGDAKERILEFLEWSEATEEEFAQEVRILLVSADFSKEITTAVMWLNEKDLDIRCVRLQPYDFNGKTLLDVQQVIPLPEASDYIVKVKEKEKSEKMAKGKPWDEQTFMKVLEDSKGLETVKIAKDILEWAKEKADWIWWGRGRVQGSFVPVIGPDGSGSQFISVWTMGYIENQFQWLANRDAFKDEELRKELLSRLNSIPGVKLPEDAITKRPSIPLERLAKENAMNIFKETYEWVIDRLRAQY